MKDSTTPVVRIVGSRTQGKRLTFLHPVPDDIEVDADAPETQEEFEARSELEELRIRQATANAIVQSLSPSAHALYLSLAPLLNSHHRVQARVAAAGRLLISIRIPSDDWVFVLEAAFGAWIETTRIQFPDLGQTARSRFADEGRSPINRFDAKAIFRDIGTSHVLLASASDDDEIIDPSLVVALDAEIVLKEIPFSCFRQAFSVAFPDAETLEEPQGFSAALLLPFAIDNACSRCESAHQVLGLIDAMSAAELLANTERKKRREAEDKPKTTTNRGVTATAILRPTSPKLEDLHGYGAAATWARDLCIDLAAYQSGELGWSDVDAGCLLYGPPGTGKTMFASALAASAGLPFVATSYAEWQSQGDGHLGYVIRTLRERFADAIEAAPAILFIDEIDVVGTRGGRPNDGDGWWTAIITALLESLDGTTRREGLVVIAACNDPKALDPALVRSGRLDRRFEIGLPDEASLARIFAHHLPGADTSALETAATVLAGTCTGADVSRIAREARRRARREKRDLVADDLLSIAMPEDSRSPEYRRLVAVHESGHALAMMVSGRIPEMMSLVSVGESSGRVRSPADLITGRLSEFEREAVILLAGRAAEEIILGEPSAGAGSDLERATALVTQVIGHNGLGGRLIASDSGVSASDVEARLRELYGRALRLITEHRSDVEALAELALERRVLSHRALTDFARDRGLGGVR